MRKYVAMLDNDFNNNVGSPILLITTLVLSCLGWDLSLLDAHHLIDIILTFIVKLAPLGTLSVAYFANKEKIDAGIKKTFKRKKK
jgi:hypothetical protein